MRETNQTYCSGKTCFLFGHGNCPPSVFPQIVAAVREYIEEKGFTDFTVGHRGNFDYMADRAVLALKEIYPHITLTRLVAYYRPHKPQYVPEGVDSIYYPLYMETVPKQFAIVKANESAVADCDGVICYVWFHSSNTYKLLKKAQKRDIPITNLGESHVPVTI